MSKMEKIDLTMENLPKLDAGKIAATFDSYLKVAIEDCDNRPHDKKPRKVIMELSMAPIPDAISTGIDALDMQFAFQAKLPSGKTRGYNFPVKRKKDQRGEYYLQPQFWEEDEVIDENPELPFSITDPTIQEEM